MSVLSPMPLKVGFAQTPISDESITSQDFEIAAEHTKKGNYQEAINKFDEILQVDDNNAKAYISRGSLHILTKNYEKAIEDLEKAEQLFGENLDTGMQQQALRQLELIKEKQMSQE